MATSELKDDLRRLARLKDEAADLNAKAKAKSNELNEFQARVWARMEQEEVESIKVSGRTFVRRAPTEYHSMQDEAVFVEWALENDPSLVSYKGNRRLLNQLVRERIDNGEELPPGLGFYTREIVSVSSA